MARLPFDKARVSRLTGRSVASYMDFVYRNSKVVIEPASAEQMLILHRPAIIAVWHGQFLLAPKVKPASLPLAIMLARHGDAEHFAEALARFNTTLIRGAGAGERRRNKNRGGLHALRESLRTLDTNVFVGMTADVPPGPARRAGEGIVTLARMSGRPIIPLATATTRYHAFKTWSRMTMNLPYGTLAGVFGEPIFVPRDADADTLEQARLAVEAGLNAVTARAYALAGADPARATPPPRAPKGPGQGAGNSALAEPAVAADAGSATAPPSKAAPITPPSAPSSVLPPSGKEPPNATPGLGLGSYRIATRLLGPATPLLLAVRTRQGREDPTRRPERLGIASMPRPDGPLIWLHAASVGELNAVLPLADGLRQPRPDVRFLFTTGTVTSAGLAARRLDRRDIHQYIPLDVPKFVHRFLAHWRPDLAVFTESEIWPNLVREIGDRHIPLTLVNGRMSDRSYARWQKFKRVSGPLFSCFDLVLAQNQELADRFAAVGARRSVSVGNLKIDAPPPPVDAAETARLRQALAGRPLLVAASTHEGEEKIVASAHRLLARALPGFCTIIAPRHPERGTDIAEHLKSSGLTVAQRSRGALPTATTDVYVADTIGELGMLYTLSPIAFIGGSLVDRGGQNPIEAVRCGAVVLTGPNQKNFTDAYGALIANSGALVVDNAETLATTVVRLTGDEAEMQRVRAGAQAALALMSGALERTVSELIDLLPPATSSKELQRAG